MRYLTKIYCLRSERKMATQNLLTHLTEKENKLAFQLFKKKKDIQLFSSNGEESCAIIDNTSLSPFNLIMAVISNEEKFCVGQYAGKNFIYPPTLPFNLMRTWIDCRDKDIKFNVTSNSKHFELSDDEDSPDDMLLLMFLQCPDFVQFSLYDGKLSLKKISHIFSSQATDKIQTIAYSMLNQHFLGFSDYLLQLEGDIHESE